jgi:UDP-N-acetylglucosamine--N-acetylmuramyl-(pentapeptide) pyrophosphoryl-undecaprenol N-acetylglucosamine transferase
MHSHKVEKGTELRVIIAGGGTGGHLFPGMAIAEEFRRRDGSTGLVFIGTERGLERRVLPDAGYDLKTIEIEGIQGRGMRAIAALIKIPWSLLQAVRIIRAFHPDIVFGVGGYASGPAVAAAWLLGIRTAIAEQNAMPGLTNRILGKIANRVFLSFPDREGRFPPDRVILSGNPVRAAFKFVPKRKERGSFTVLVFGGSQGARSINRAMLEALPFLKGMRTLKIVHQTGPVERERVAEGYRTAAPEGLSSEVVPFIADMASAYEAADVLICRAGATSIAEITACGKASILIPFPYAVNDHQTQNAKVLADAGAAELIPERDLSGEVLAGLIRALSADPDRIARMESKAAALGKRDSAFVIVDECLKLIEKTPG